MHLHIECSNQRDLGNLGWAGAARGTRKTKGGEHVNIGRCFWKENLVPSTLCIPFAHALLTCIPEHFPELFHFEHLNRVRIKFLCGVLFQSTDQQVWGGCSHYGVSTGRAAQQVMILVRLPRSGKQDGARPARWRSSWYLKGIVRIQRSLFWVLHPHQQWKLYLTSLKMNVFLKESCIFNWLFIPFLSTMSLQKRWNVLFQFHF